MKITKTMLLMLLNIAILSSCNVDQADTEFNVVRNSQEADDGLLDIADNEEISFCAQFNDDGDEVCDDYEECQPMYDDNQIFLACIEKEIPPVVDYPPVLDDEPYRAPGAEDDDDEDKDCDKKKPGQRECKGRNQIVICHIPPGNPAAAHSICISQRGWENGHKDRHGNDESRDYLGACSAETLDNNMSVDPQD